MPYLTGNLTHNFIEQAIYLKAYLGPCGTLLGPVRIRVTVFGKRWKTKMATDREKHSLSYRNIQDRQVKKVSERERQKDTEK